MACRTTRHNQARLIVSDPFRADPFRAVGWRLRIILTVWLGAGIWMPLLPDFNTRRLVLTGILAATSLLALGAGRRAVLPAWTIGLCTVVFVLGLLSAVSGATFAWSLLGVAYAVMLVTAAATLSGALRPLRLDPAIGVAVAFTLPVVLLCCAMVATIYSALLTGVPLHYPEPLRDFANIRFFNQYQTWMLPFLPAAVTLACPLPRVRPVVWRALIITIGVFFWAMYWRSAGRGTGYATLIATVFVALACGPAGRRHAGWTIVLAGLGLAAELAMFDTGGHPAHLWSSTSPGRWHLWHVAVDQIAAHPWLGIGPLMFAGLDSAGASHPHSAALQWAAEWGLPAATIAIAGFTWLAIRWMRALPRLLRYRSRTPACVSAALTAALVAGSAHALVSGVVVMPASQFMLVMIAGVAMAVYPAHIRPMPPPSTVSFATAIRAIFLVFIALSALYSAGFTAYDYHTRVRTAPPDTAIYQRNALQPRFWADGTLVTVTTKPSS